MTASSVGRTRGMMRIFIASGTLLCLAASITPAARAQSGATLIVNVTNFESGAPVISADVFLGIPSLHARTDTAGLARFHNLPKGFYEMQVRRLGYAAAEMRMAVQVDSSSLDVMLRPTATSLDTVHVVASAITTEQHRQFELRRKKGIGRFLGPDDLERERYVEFPIVATEHFPGIGIAVGRGGQFQLASSHGSCGVDTAFEDSPAMAMRNEQLGAKMTGAGSGAQQTTADAATSQGSCFSDHPCHVKLFLNDQPIAEQDIGTIHTRDLYGVEYYSTGNAPPRYQVSGAACGIILLWTKAGNSG